MKTLSPYELDDVCNAIAEFLDDKEELLSIVSRTNRTGELEELLRILNIPYPTDEDICDAYPRTIVVLGDSMIKKSKLISLARNQGFNPNEFEFVLEYEQIQRYKFAKLRNTYVYRAVLVGPMPHSSYGKKDSSSAITEMEAHPEIYPPIIELRDANGLKISNNSFREGLKKLEALAY